MLKLLNARGDIFFFGISSNQSQFYKMFDTIFILEINKKTLLERLKNRTTNSFGKDPTEQKDILSWHKWFEKDLEDKGAIVIDASGTIDQTVDEILSHLS
jgi:thymidylate kinase